MAVIVGPEVRGCHTVFGHRIGAGGQLHSSFNEDLMISLAKKWIWIVKSSRQEQNHLGHHLLPAPAQWMPVVGDAARGREVETR